MSIKSDKWIRRMAEQTGMIEPFEPGQVRQVDGLHAAQFIQALRERLETPALLFVE